MPPQNGQNPTPSAAPVAARSAGSKKWVLWLVVGAIIIAGMGVGFYVTQFPMGQLTDDALPTEDMQMMADDGSVAADGSLMVSDAAAESSPSITPPPPPPGLPGSPSN